MKHALAINWCVYWRTANKRCRNWSSQRHGSDRHCSSFIGGLIRISTSTLNIDETFHGDIVPELAAALLVGLDVSVPEFHVTPNGEDQISVRKIPLPTPAGTPISDFKQLSSKTWVTKIKEPKC